MRRTCVQWFLVLMVWFSPAVLAQDSLNFPTIGEIIRLDERLNDIIAPDAHIEVLASGFAWAEGPLWIEDDKGGALLFSDIPNNRIMRWQDGVGITLFMKPAGYTGLGGYGKEPGSNGLALDRQGRIVLCEHGDRRLAVLTQGGGKRTLVDNYQGKRLNSPNDCIVKSNGDIYFTDPPYGLKGGLEGPLSELGYCGVYRYATDGKIALLTKELRRPNGIAFSVDEETLYVAQSDKDEPILAGFPVKADGTLGPKRIVKNFKDQWDKLPGAPDGLKVDVNGILFVTAPGGVHVLTPEGESLGRISTGERTANCGWGDDGASLYITADTYLCRVKTKTKGNDWRYE